MLAERSTTSLSRAEEHVADESGVDSEVSIEEPELGADIAVAASSTDEWRAPEPDVEPEPLTESDSRDDEPTIADAAIAAMVAGAAVEGAIDEEPSPAQDDSRDDGPTFADAAMAATAAALAGGATRQEPPSEEPSAEDAWDADAEPAVAAELELPVEPEPAFPPPVWAQEPEPAPEDAESSDVAGESADAEAEPEPGPSWEADLWPEPEPEPSSLHRRRSSPPWWQPRNPRTPTSTLPRTTRGHIPEAAIAAAAIAASQPEIEARRPDVPWLDRPDQTEVYPDDVGAARTPSPGRPRGFGQRRASHRGDSHDARSGRARSGRRARRGADHGRGGRAVADRRDPAARRHGDRAAGPDLCRRCVARRWRGRLTDASGRRIRRRRLRSVDRAEPHSEDQPVAVAGSIGRARRPCRSTATSR